MASANAPSATTTPSVMTASTTPYSAIVWPSSRTAYVRRRENQSRNVMGLHLPSRMAGTKAIDDCGAGQLDFPSLELVGVPPPLCKLQELRWQTAELLAVFFYIPKRC